MQILVQRLRSELELYKVLGFTHCSSSVLFVWVPNFFFSSSSIPRSNACKWKKDLEPKYHKRKKLLRHEGNCMNVIYKEKNFMDAGKGEGLWVLHTISAFLSASPTIYSSDPITSISSTSKFHQISLVHSKAKTTQSSVLP